MASISATITFSYANITTGRITATPKQSFIDGTGKLVIEKIPFPSVNITSSTATITLPSTKDFGVAYTFVIETGVNPNFVFVDTFDAIIDNIASQNGNTLLTQHFSQDLLDTSVWTIADLLSKSPFLDRLANRIPGFSYKPYTNTITFIKNDITFRNDRFYQWQNTASGSAIDPITTGNYHDPGNYLDGTLNPSASWLVVSPNLKGSGTTTTDIDYNKTTFLPLATQPASRENLAQLDDLLRSQISAPDLTNYARKDQANAFTAAQNFGNGATVPLLLSNDDSSSVASTKTVRAILAATTSTNLTNKISILEERYSQGISASLTTGTNVRQLNTILRNGNNDIVSLTNAIITIKVGTYLIFATVISNRCNGSKIFLYDNGQATNLSTRSMSSYTGANLANSSSQNVENNLTDVISFGSQTSLTLRHIIETGASDAGGLAANRSGYSELFSRIVFFRLD